MGSDRPYVPMKPDLVAAVPQQLGKRLDRAIRKLVDVLSTEQQLEVLGEPDDMSALVHALLARDVPRPEADHELLNAQLRGVAARRELVAAEGGCVPVAELERLLGKSRQAIEKQREAGTLLAVQMHGVRGWLYPLWQIQDGAPLPGLAKVSRQLPSDDPWSSLAFFLRADAGGGVTPLAALRHGDAETALRAARTFGQQGAT